MSVLFCSTDVTTIRTIQDRLSNILAVSEGPWSLELKVYRANSASFTNTDREGETIYTVASSTEKDTVWLYAGREALKLDRGIVPILSSKLQSLWVPRQVFRVDGESFMIDDEIELKIGNAFLQGTYKGFVIQIEDSSAKTVDQLKDKIQQVISQCDIPAEVPETVAQSDMELYRQYSKLNR